MKKAELKKLLALRETQLSNAVDALRHLEGMINRADYLALRNYPIIVRDGFGIIRVKMGLIEGGSDIGK